MKSMHPTTPDGRYFVVRGRLWRCSNPSLSAEEKARLTRDLMAARRAKQTAMRAADADARETARRQVDEAKIALGERGPVWWADGAPDLNRRMARNTSYASWYEALIKLIPAGANSG
jgi:hypothetical protein